MSNYYLLCIDTDQLTPNECLDMINSKATVMHMKFNADIANADDSYDEVVGSIKRNEKMKRELQESN